MRKVTRKVLLVFALLFVLANTSCDSSLTLINQSDYSIVDVRLAPVGTVSWGPNLAGGEIPPGGSLTIDFIDCGDYDVRIIDDTNTECVLPSLRLCFENADWYITNADLANCGFQ
ncbi:MAG: hypothetical protein KC503_34160 [Myxococcales bacterium]|nr:hypothetical protein [Myxococcales bacterium]